MKKLTGVFIAFVFFVTTCAQAAPVMPTESALRAQALARGPAGQSLREFLAGPAPTTETLRKASREQELQIRLQQKPVIGVVTEIKPFETRVGITPKEVAELVKQGNIVLIQKGAGIKSGISDEEYSKAGAVLLDSAEAVWKAADIIKKVKEPLPEEYKYFRKGLTIYTYFHLANPENETLTRELINSGVTAIAYETVEVNGQTPLLSPMSDIAGWVAPIWATAFRQEAGDYGEIVSQEDNLTPELIVTGANVLVKELKPHIISNFETMKNREFRFSKELLATIEMQEDGPGDVVVLGGGRAGVASAYMSLLLGAKSVTIAEKFPHARERLKRYFKDFGDRVRIIDSGSDADHLTPELINALEEADLTIGAAYNRSEEGSEQAPKIINETTLERISRHKKKVIVDIAIDQGGNIVPAFLPENNDIFTSHERPGRLDKFGNLRISVPNMPAAFGIIATPWLSEVTQPILLTIASGKNALDIVKEHPEIASGVSVINNRLCDSSVAKAHNKDKSTAGLKRFVYSGPVTIEELREVFHFCQGNTIGPKPIDTDLTNAAMVRAVGEAA